MAAGLVTVVTAASANMPICFMNILHCRLNIVTLRPYSYDTAGAGLSWPWTGKKLTAGGFISQQLWSLAP